MKNKRIFDAIGQIGDDLIADAAENKKKKTNHAWIKWGIAAAACFGLAAGAALHFGSGFGGEDYPDKQVADEPPVSSSAALSEIARVPYWDELAVWQQFGSIDNHWSCSGAEVPAELVGGKLDTVTLVGRDEYNPEDDHRIKADTYAIEGISDKCAIAVQYEGTDTWYSFFNSGYRPETLGEFLDDLNLREHISFGTIYYDYQKNNHERASVEFHGITVDKVWELLMDAREAENIHDDLMMTHRVMGISTNISLLGFHNISIAVTEEGYLTTNILATGKTFDIGKDRVEAFAEYVKKNLEAYEIVYRFETAPEDGGGESQSVPSSPPPASTFAASPPPVSTGASTSSYDPARKE